MSFLGNLQQKVPFFDRIAESFTPALTRDERFKLQYRLPPDEKILDDTNADISFVGAFSKAHARKESGQTMAYVYSGKLYLTPHFLVFKDTFDENSCDMTLNISTVKRVERAPETSYVFALNVTLYNGTKILIQFLGLRYRSEQFCNLLKDKLKENIPVAKKLPSFLDTCYSEFLINKNVLKLTDINTPKAGLGQKYKYPGNPQLSQEKMKLRLWFDYFKENGLNLAIVKNHIFQKLIRVGVPNRMRGEIWELCSGALYLRYANSDEYQNILEENQGKKSRAIDEIEKDLNRSLPEYTAYQKEEGISRLRNVLTAYSWKNPDVGYCQAMNIVAAGLLIFMTEEQAFWCLTTLCENFVPGYYSKTMYGTLLDQKVFETLVSERLPELWDHIEANDIQLSVVSLPWFLSLFFTSMPLEFAFRIMDIFFMNGYRTLFQVSLAILKVNSEDLLQAEEDGMFIAILKNYFRTLDESAHPDSDDPKFKHITKFQELLVTAFKEFNIITDEMVSQERNKHRKRVFENIEIFVKKTQVRQMPKTFHLKESDLSNIYEIFYQSVETYKISLGTGSANMNFEIFSQFLGKFCDWCKPTSNDTDPIFIQQKNDFLHKLFNDWDVNEAGELTLNNVISGLDKLVTKDLMELLTYFFSLFDGDKDGELKREEVLQMSEALLFLTTPWKSGIYVDDLTLKTIEMDIADNIIKENGDSLNSMEDLTLPTGVTINEEKYKNEQIERYLKAASNFLKRSFEYAKSLELPEDFNLIDLSDNEEDDIKKKKFESIKHNAALDPAHPKAIDVATFRMIILADETYEIFFGRTLRESIHVDEPCDADPSKNRALRGMFDGIIADGRRVAAQVRRRVDSVATTKSAAASIHTTGHSETTSNFANTSRDDRFEDLDDFSSELQEEHEDLLDSPWVEMTMEKEDSEGPERKLLNIPTKKENIEQPDESHNLLEFEA
ncbi:hypothetical protein TBLA_0E00590 [Henningerozyma blattae CBS 6284]|uniref:Rab-GAP TBC domain-containing protein n=1 Tax=Henningerozyma blattae (strain ATCC 34711 / CBS 6284 / DSM 70876 / NBRC 10599 / NRRL Y-10934 / UCD 77-7) TaxID=1071380 RepID=I2H418_HENB6|nr:hypothetical protein TBLA_0E00590 [Tetrapisispora blattae CBS 6284]CCH61120.1 hypothetical protein TBLA_0E00590 [Tetrapisispora blattae CBS 6284]